MLIRISNEPESKRTRDCPRRTFPAILFRVVEDDPERVPVSGAQTTDPVVQVHARCPARAFRGPVIDRKGHRVALAKGNHFALRQTSRILLDQQEFAARSGSASKMMTCIGNAYR
jgi:hypothetical protein